MPEMIAVFVVGLVCGGLIVSAWRMDSAASATQDDTEQRVGWPL